MTEAELVEKYTRVVKTSLGQWVQAMTVKESLSGPPSVSWKGVGRMLPVRALSENVELARRAALKDRRFFRMCEQCNEIRPISQIPDSEMCADCNSVTEIQK